MTQFAARFPKNARSDGIAVTLHAFQLEPQPMVALGRVVFQQHWSSSVGRHEHVDRTVVVIVAHSQTPRSKISLKRRTRALANVVELPVFTLMEQKQWLFVFHLHRIVINHVIRMATGQQEINRAVVVVIEILQPPSAQQSCSARHAMRLSGVAKSLISVVFVNRKHLVINIGDKQVLPPVSVEIGCIHSHARTGPPALAESNTRLQCNFLPIPAAIGAGAAIHKQKILHRVISDEEIHLLDSGTNRISFTRSTFTAVAWIWLLHPLNSRKAHNKSLRGHAAQRPPGRGTWRVWERGNSRALPHPEQTRTSTARARSRLYPRV